MNKFDKLLNEPEGIWKDRSFTDEEIGIMQQALSLASFMQERKEYFVWQDIENIPLDTDVHIFCKFDGVMLAQKTARRGDISILYNKYDWATDHDDRVVTCETATHYMRLLTEEIQAKLKEILNDE